MIRDQRCGKRSDGSTKTCGTQPGLEGLRARRRGRGRGVPAPPARVAPLHRPGCCRQRVFRLQTSKAKAAQVGMIIFFRLRPNGNENSSLGQELDFFFFFPTPRPTKRSENLLEMLRADVAIFRATRAGSANVFRNAFPKKILPVFLSCSEQA